MFDLDGTLLDTAPDLIAACQATLRQFNFKEGDSSQIAQKLTSGMRAMLKQAIPAAKQDDGLIDGPMRSYFASYYTRNICRYTRAFPGIVQLLQDMQQADIKCAVITNKYLAMAEKLLSGFSFYNTLSLILGGDSCVHAKPHPEPLLTACNKLGIAPQQTLYVGDHLNDIIAAQAAGCVSCCALWGYGAAECGDPQAWHSDYYAKNVQDLKTLVFSYQQLHG